MFRKTGKEYLRDFLQVAPLSHALWRSTEALFFGQLITKKPILDLGCGFGEFSGVVFGKIDCGLDISQRDLKIALSGGRYSKTIKANARKLPFEDGYFSTVISVSVLEHIVETQQVISEVGRVLKKGGTFAFSVPTPELYKHLLASDLFESLHLSFLSRAYIQLHRFVFKHNTIKNVDWWRKSLKENGFEIVEYSGSVSRKITRFHELFLLTALPSQIWRWIFGKRLILFDWRAKILPLLFGKYVFLDKKSGYNVIFVARKK